MCVSQCVEKAKWWMFMQVVASRMRWGKTSRGEATIIHCYPSPLLHTHAHSHTDAHTHTHTQRLDPLLPAHTPSPTLCTCTVGGARAQLTVHLLSGEQEKPACTGVIDDYGQLQVE